MAGMSGLKAKNVVLVHGGQTSGRDCRRGRGQSRHLPLSKPNAVAALIEKAARE